MHKPAPRGSDRRRRHDLGAVPHEERYVQAGQVFVAAPVLGRPDRAAAGELGIIPASPADVIERLQVLFEVMGKSTFIAGNEPEAAAAIKIAQTIQPGMKENDLQAVTSYEMHRLGAQWIHNVRVTSGNRTHPHPHLSSDRLIQPGDMIFMDIVLLFNGYHTCVYRCFCCGKPTGRQKEIHKHCLDYQLAGLNAVKPGVTTADIARVWPDSRKMGFETEAECFGLSLVTVSGSDSGSSRLCPGSTASIIQ